MINLLPYINGLLYFALLNSIFNIFVNLIYKIIYFYYILYYIYIYTMPKSKKLINNNNNNNNNNNTTTLNNFKDIIKESTEDINQKETLTKIFDFFKSNVNETKFNTLYKKTKFFGSDKLGKSGALVGVLKIKGKEYVIKMYKIQEKYKYIYKYEPKCIKLYFPFNELIINTIFSNMDTFLSPASNNTYNSKYSHFFIPTKNIGLSDTYSYMISDKIGLTYEKQFFTNLYDLFIEDYIPKLLNYINKEDKATINAFLTKLVEILTEYFDCMKFLNENLGYINSDLKCKNVFIKENDEESLDTFITNFTPLISDLDKATIEINGVLILPRPDKRLEKYLAKRTLKLSKAYEIRYNCSRNTALCNKFKPYQYDIITLLFDIYIILYKEIFKQLKLSRKDYYDYFKVLNEFVKKTLNINDEEFAKFYKRIHKSYLLKISSETRFSFHINAMLYNFCKSL